MKHLFGDFVFSISFTPILTARAFLSNSLFITPYLTRHFFNHSKMISFDVFLFHKPYFLFKREELKVKSESLILDFTPPWWIHFKISILNFTFNH
jgi:hypothetical protein